MKACETVYRTLARQTNLPEFKEPIMISTAPSCAILTPLSVKEARFYFYTLLFVTGNIAFPAICHLAPNGGPTLLPIYFFTLIAGYRFGWPAALATAILSPVANHFLTGMPPKNTGRGKFAKFMTYHVFGNINRDEFIAVVHCDCLANEIGRNHRSARPGFDHSLLVGFNILHHAFFKFVMDVWAFFK